MVIFTNLRRYVVDQPIKVSTAKVACRNKTNLSINLQMTRGSCSTWSSSNERKWVSNECGERSETFNRNVLVEIAIAVKLSLNGGW